MKKTMKKTISGFMVMIAILAGITAGAEAATTWLGSINMEEPTRVAIDSLGKVYVNETVDNRLSIYDRKGNRITYTGISGLKYPSGIAVDSTGKIYIGNDTVTGTSYIGNVTIYNPGPNNTYTFWKRIGGISKSEITSPSAIGVTSNGNIYIVDSKLHKVKVYNSEGVFSFEFGGYSFGDGVTTGSEDGKFNSPLDIAIDETADELYIIDAGIFIDNNGIPTEGARVQVFDLAGNFLRSFDRWGYKAVPTVEDPTPIDDKMVRPVGISIDKMKRLSITDSLLGRVQIYDINGNHIETIEDPDHPLITPIGIAVGLDERMYIVSSRSNPRKLEIYGLEDYTLLGVTPKEISLSGYAGGTAAGQDITISNSGLGDMQWETQREAGSEWITLSKESGQIVGTASEAVTVAADLSSLAEGTYTGKFKVITDGAEEEVTVNLQVDAGGILEVTPLDLTYTGQAGGSQPGTHIVTITLTGGDMNWTAQSNAPSWLSIDPATGSAGSAVTATVTVDTTGLAAGQYSSSITITADGATGSPVDVNVELTLISAGKIEVTTNIEEANWNISGEAVYQGSGTQWSQYNAPSGQYQISFGAVSGYMKPQDQTFTVQSGNTTAIDVIYKDLRASKKIIAGLGSGRRNPSEIKILNTDGTIAGADFIAFRNRYGVNVAAGDINGDGIDEIIAGAGANMENLGIVKIFTADGTAIPGAAFIAFRTRYGVNVAAGDIDGDGKAEIIVGTGIGIGNSANIRVFKSVDGAITDTGINNIVDISRYGVYVAAGDIDGDGTDEIITGTGPGPRTIATVRILKADTSAEIGSWTVAEINAIIVNEAGKGAVVAAGDLNGDGRAEILAGSSYTLNIKTYNADGSPYGVEITDTNTYKGASITAGDTDADGIAEIVIGAGADKDSPAEISIYSADGALMNSFTAFSQLGGVNVCLGKVE